MSVSILLPIRKAEKTLRRSIDSVLCQTYKDFELICILNDSSLEDEEIVKSYAEKDDRVKICHSSPGLVPALNCGLAFAKHDIIARQDADDYWYPEKLEKQLAFLSKRQDVDILGAQIRSVDESFQPTNQEPLRPISDNDIKEALLSGWNCIPHPGVIFRKRIMERLGGYDDTFLFAEDYSLWLRAIQWYRFAQLDEVLLDYTAKHNPRYNHQVPQFLCSVFRAFYGVQ